MKNKDTTLEICDECGSSYFKNSSKMNNLCPECAYIIYGYPPCRHEFVNNRCSKCNWDGSVSDYFNNKKRDNKN